MKAKSIMLLIAIIFFFENCGDNKAATNEKQPTGTASVENKPEQTKTISTSGNGLVGTWKLRVEVFDDNSNRVPDEEEIKKAYSNNYMLQLNADGSCKIQQVFTGRYEKKIENGKEMLYVYRKRIEQEEDKDPPPDIFQIISLKKDELVLLIIDAAGSSAF